MASGRSHPDHDLRARPPSMRDEAMASDRSSSGPIASRRPMDARSFRDLMAASASAAASATSNRTTGAMAAIASGTKARYGQ